MGIRVAVAGASGYAGGELLRLLAGHPDLEIGAVTGAAARASRSPPSTLTSPATRRSTAATSSHRRRTLGGAELIFMALPHGESAALAERAARRADRRPVGRLPAGRRGRLAQVLRRRPLRRPLGLRPARAARRPGADQGRPHGRRARLLRHHVDPRARPAAGRGPRRARRHRDRRRLRHLGRRPLAPPRPARQRGHGQHVRLQGRRRAPAHPGDRAGAHRGAQTFVRTARGAAARHVSFTPVLAPMPRGILATCTARLRAGRGRQPGPGPRRCAPRSPTRTRAARSCTCCPTGQWPVTGAVAGSNGAHLQVTADPHAGRAVVVAATDNLGKGAAGQAVQIANLMLGLPETAGLTTHGVAP